RPLGGELGVVEGFLEVGRVGALGEVLGQLGGVLFETAGVDGLEAASDLLVQPQPLRGEDLLVKGLAEEGVREAEGEETDRGPLLDDRPLRRLLNRRLDLFFTEAASGRN